MHTELLTKDLHVDCTDYHEARPSLIVCCVLCIISGRPALAHQILSELLKIQDLVWSDQQKSVLELLWRHLFPRPDHVPWEKWSDDELGKAAKEHDVQNMEFWNSHAEVDWLTKPPFNAKVAEEYDVHQWKGSDDAATHAVCARLLCKPVDGAIPSHAAMEESLDCMDQLLAKVAPLADNVPHHHIVSGKTYFILAVHLGKMDKAVHMLKRACQADSFELHNLVTVPAFYNTLSQQPDGTVIHPLLSDKYMDDIGKKLVQAIKSRAENGLQEPLHGVSWHDLLTRFANAAFIVNHENYLEQGITSAAGILLPPATPSQIAEVEARTGPLPADLKDMVLIANGFKGGYHFAAGGFAGISLLMAEPLNESHEIQLGIDPPPRQSLLETQTLPDGTTRTVFRNTVEFPGSGTGRNWGNVLTYSAGEESDFFEHLICPPATWAKVRGGKAREGEYRLVLYTNWGHHEEWKGVRDWLANLTLKLERKASAVERARKRQKR